MFERGERPRLAPQPIRVRSGRPRRHLDCDVSREPAIACAKYDPHSAASDLLVQLITSPS
jgi:hypothetical protein